MGLGNAGRASLVGMQIEGEDRRSQGQATLFFCDTQKDVYKITRKVYEGTVANPRKSSDRRTGKERLRKSRVDTSVFMSSRPASLLARHQV